MTGREREQAVRICFAGDVVIQEGDDILLSDRLKECIGRNDVRVCNFEAPVKGAGKPVRKAGPLLHQWEKAPEIIQDWGFNLIGLANNHICDYGKEALLATVEAFGNGVTVGAGKNFEEAYRLKKVTAGGMEIGFLSFGEWGWGALTEENSTDAGYAWINHEAVNSIVKQAANKTDFLIILAHAGVEQIELPLPEWRRRYRELLDMGADVIIASHPHVPQGWENYGGKMIFYSLGNFYFDMFSAHPLWNKGMLVELSVYKDRTLSFEVSGIERKERQLNLIQDGTFDKEMKVLNQKLCCGDYMAEINRIALELWDAYYYRHWENAVNGITRFRFLHLFKFIKRLLCRKALNVEMLQHNMKIESNLWLVERAIDLLSKRKYE